MAFGIRGSIGRAGEGSATSVARLWRDLGKLADARELLAPIYQGFTEGFNSPDLKEAKALLDALECPT